MAATADQPPRATARRVLIAPSSWTPPLVVATLVVLLLSLLYVGGIVNAQPDVRHLPVAVVNQDNGDTGRQLATALSDNPQVNKRLSQQPLTLTQVHQAMDNGHLYGAIVIPADLTATLGAVAQQSPAPTAAPAHPAVTLLTNPRAGSLGVSLFTGAAQPALAAASQQIGTHLSTFTPPSPALSAADRILLANPLTITTTPCHPLASHAGAGLTAFYAPQIGPLKTGDT